MSWGAAAAYRLTRRDAAALCKILSFISGTTSSSIKMANDKDHLLRCNKYASNLPEMQEIKYPVLDHGMENVKRQVPSLGCSTEDERPMTSYQVFPGL